MSRSKFIRIHADWISYPLKHDGYSKVSQGTCKSSIQSRGRESFEIFTLCSLFGAIQKHAWNNQRHIRHAFSCRGGQSRKRCNQKYGCTGLIRTTRHAWKLALVHLTVLLKEKKKKTEEEVACRMPSWHQNNMHYILSKTESWATLEPARALSPFMKHCPYSLHTWMKIK